jgi:zinc transport system substrate-binding protein
MKKKLMLLLGTLLFLTAVGAIIIKISAPKADIEAINEEDKLKVVTTFYPVYMIGLNVAGQAKNIEVKSLTNLNTGCLHDYQLTTEDMKIISSADVMIINGGGMESFLEDVATNYPALTIINASQGITMLQNEGEEEHENENDLNTEVEGTKEDATEDTNKSSTEVEVAASDEADVVTVEEDDHDHGEYNPHVWLDPKLYIKQIENVRDGLMKYVKDSDMDISNLSQDIEENAQTYIQEVMDLDNEIEEARKDMELTSEQGGETQVVIFHDSFAYLANRIGMKVAFTVPLDSDTALSAGDIAEIINVVREDQIKYLFTEQQYSDSIAKQIEAETEAKVYIIDSAVTGDGSKDSYLTAMRNNLIVLKDALSQIK